MCIPKPAVLWGLCMLSNSEVGDRICVWIRMLSNSEVENWIYALGIEMKSGIFFIDMEEWESDSFYLSKSILLDNSEIFSI